MEIQEELIVRSGFANGVSDAVCSGNGVERNHRENGVVQVGVDEDEKAEIDDVVSESLEEHLEDVTDRLMISRMVSDSVVKGMVTAVEPAERIPAKELEVANLKRYLQSREMGTISDVCLKHEKMREDLTALRKLTREQLEKASKEVEHTGGANSVKKIGSGSELVALSGILQEKQSEGWGHVDMMLDGLNTTLDAFCSKVDDILVSSEIFLRESREDQDILGNLEDIVMHSVIKRLQEEQNAYVLHGIQTVNWLEKFNGLSDLGTQLKEIQKSLCIREAGLVSHGSHNLDNSHHKTFGDHVGENGTVDEINVHVAKSYDFQQLKHLTKEQLVGYFNDTISKLKRDHESVLHNKTEEIFLLKREFLKERGSLRKYEEFDALRTKIPEIISKLEGFLSENEKFPALTNLFESVGKLKLSLDNLRFENCQLKDSLNDHKNEVKCLEAQVSDAAEALLQSSLAEDNLLNLLVNLKSSMEDSCIEASVTEEVYKSALREQILQTKYASADSNMEICDIIIRKSPNRCEYEDSDIESWIMQGLSGLIFTEAIVEIKNCLENTALEKENELRLEVEENKKLKQDIQDLRSALEQKEKLAIDLSISLSKEREKFEAASRELSSLRELSSQLQTLFTEGNVELELLRSQHLVALDQIEVDEINLRQLTSQLQTLVEERNRDFKLLRSQHLEALDQIKVDKMELLKDKQKLDQTKEDLSEANKEKNRALAVAQEMHGKLLLSEARVETLKKEMGLTVSGLWNILNDFECRISEAVRENSIRFENTTSHVKVLKKVAKDLRRREQKYKQDLDSKSVNLQKAESEVDLLGDEVESLLRLLHKIYIALDHYSPVFKHYPGIIDILELVKRELRGESTMLL